MVDTSRCIDTDNQKVRLQHLLIAIVINKSEKKVLSVNKYHSAIYQAAETSFSTNCKLSFLSTAL